MNKITKDELMEAVNNKLRFSFDIPKFTEEERERIVEKMSAHWPDFYDGTKATIGSMVVTGILVIFGAMKYYKEGNWLISGAVYVICCLIFLGCLAISTTGHYAKAKDKEIFKIYDVWRWAVKTKPTIITVLLNITYIIVTAEMFMLHYWFVGTALLLMFGFGYWMRKRHNEEITNRLSRLARVSKDELG
jgi:hypothetical protein